MEREARAMVRAIERKKRDEERGIKHDENEELLDHLTELIHRKIVERTARAQDQYREGPNGEITMELFKQRMANLGLVITDADLGKLFRRYDDNDSGVISFHEMIRNVMPNDYNYDRFAVHRAEKNERAYIAHAMPFVKAPKMEKMPELDDHEVDIKHLMGMIHVKILERTRRSEDQYRESYRLFKCPGGRITEPEFKRRMRVLGLVITDHDLHRLFQAMDDNGNGVLDFSEMVHHVMPKDLGYDPFEVHRAKAYEAQYVKRAMKQSASMLPATEERMPSYLDDAKVTVEDYENLIQRKLLQRVKRSSDQFREAYRVVGAAGGQCDLATFTSQMKRLGVHIPRKDLAKVFDHLADGRRAINVQVMLRRLMPADFTEPVGGGRDKPPTPPPRPGRTPWSTQRSDRGKTPTGEADWSISKSEFAGLDTTADGSASRPGGGAGDAGEGGGMAASLSTQREEATRKALAASAAGLAASGPARPQTPAALVAQQKTMLQPRPSTSGSRRPPSRAMSRRSARGGAGGMAGPATPSGLGEATAFDKEAAMAAYREHVRKTSRRHRRAARAKGKGSARGRRELSVVALGGGLKGGDAGLPAASPVGRPSSAPAHRRRQNAGMPPTGRAKAAPAWVKKEALDSTRLLAEHLRLRSAATYARSAKGLRVGKVPVNYMMA